MDIKALRENTIDACTNEIDGFYNECHTTIRTLFWLALEY